MHKVRVHTRRAIVNIVLSRPKDMGTESDNSMLDFVRPIVRNEMMSSRSMAKLGSAAKDAAMSDNIIRRIAGKVA